MSYMQDIELLIQSKTSSIRLQSAAEKRMLEIFRQLARTAPMDDNKNRA